MAHVFSGAGLSAPRRNHMIIIIKEIQVNDYEARTAKQARPWAE